MVRPGFAKLPLEQRQRILRVALEEFAAHGFRDASLNRIIRAAGISKGSMYYYFDGKADLFAHLARTELEKLFSMVGPLPELEGSANQFWAVLEGYYLRLLTALAHAPQLAALLRGWATTAASPDLEVTTRELEQASLPWLAQLIQTGQRLGAVRDDVPDTLLSAVVTGMGEAMDMWMLTQDVGDNELPDLAGMLLGMIRRAVSP